MEEIAASETIAAPRGPFAEAVVASAEADANRIELLFESDELLRTPMNDTDVVLKAAELAAVHEEIEKLDSELNAATAKFKAEKECITDARDEKISHGNHLARLIRDRTHENIVHTREEKVFATGMIRTVRCDTNEVVRMRPIEADERQADLFAETVDDDEAAPIDAPEDGEPEDSDEVPADDRECPACGDKACSRPTRFDGETWAHSDEETTVALDPDKIVCRACGIEGCDKPVKQTFVGDEARFEHIDLGATKSRRGRK